MSFPVFDLHCDTALALLGDEKHGPQRLRDNTLHNDLTRAGKLVGYAQCFACFTTPMMEKWGMGRAEDVFRREYEAISREIQANSDLIAWGCTADQVEALDTAGATEDVFIIELERNVPQRIRMFIWLEGQDVDCVDSVNSSSFMLNIELAGGSE